MLHLIFPRGRPEECDDYSKWDLFLVLVVANFANTRSHKKSKKWLKPWHMGTHMRVLNESYPMNPHWKGWIRTEAFVRGSQNCRSGENWTGNILVKRDLVIRVSHYHDQRIAVARP